MRCCLVLIREPRRSREPIRTYATHHPTGSKAVVSVT